MSNSSLSRQDIIKWFYKYPNVNWTTLDVLNEIEKIPPTETKTGHWIEHKRAEETHDALISNYECSECHDWLPETYTFCPTCGTHMKGFSA